MNSLLSVDKRSEIWHYLYMNHKQPSRQPIIKKASPILAAVLTASLLFTGADLPALSYSPAAHANTAAHRPQGRP
ncbi:MAG: hypothetical protein LBI54_05045 [Lachnospiraceae bacterium]|jgi:hypothetical protein|nr:hypothetical protein [Lachnospiraceae bacterium]